MTNHELQQLVEELSHSFFQKPFRHHARFNPRLRTTGGRYLLKSHDIEINPTHAEMFGSEEMIGIIKHELCHYHLHIEGKGYHHSQPDFKKLLQAVGGSRYCQSTGKRRTVTTRYQYVCIGCGIKFERKRKVDIAKYRCGTCRGKLRLVASFRQK